MIGFIIKLMLTRGISMKRWNNFPRIEDVFHLDNVGFVIHIALFLAYLEEKEGKKIDREFLIKRIIFQSFYSLILSDINSGTRDYIFDIDNKIQKEIEKKALNKILEKPGPEIIKKDILKTLENDSKILELKIIKVAKRYAGYQECLINSKVFSDMYDIPLNTIKKDLKKLRKDLKSLDILLKNKKYKKFLSHIRRLSHSIRWNQQKRIFPISVMSHLVITTFFVYFIGIVEKKKKNDIQDLLLRGIYHDIPEAITGDIITPTKKSIKGFSEILENVEKNMMDDYIFFNIENDFKEKIFNYIFHPFDGDNGKTAKYADVLSSLFEAKIEINYGGKIFIDVYKNIKKKVNCFNIKSVDYILKEGMDSFDENINNISLG